MDSGLDRVEGCKGWEEERMFCSEGITCKNKKLLGHCGFGVLPVVIWVLGLKRRML